MERVKSFNRERILWCCDDNSITVAELAARLKIASLPEAMVGKSPITIRQLQKIADFFNRDILFFMSSAPIRKDTAYTPQYRTVNSQKSDLSREVKAVMRRAEFQRRVYIDLLQELGEPLPRFWAGHDFKADSTNIKRTAATAREWLQIKGGSVDFSAFREAIEKKGVLAIRSNGYAGKWQIPKGDPILGISLYYEQCPIIIVKKQRSAAAQTFSLIHELGHLLLHKSSFADDERDLFSYTSKEKEANAFAGNLLVPDDFLRQVAMAGVSSLPVDRYDDYFKKYATQWGVSVEVVLRRLLDEQKIHQRDYQGYREYRNEQPIPEDGPIPRAYRNREPLYIFGRPYVEAVLESLNQRQISLYKASTFLDDLAIKELRKLEGSLVSL